MILAEQQHQHLPEYLGSQIGRLLVLTGALWSKTNFSLACLILTFLHLFLRRDPRIRSKLAKFPGPPEIPVLGHLHHFLRPHDKYLPLFAKWVEKYKPVVVVWMGPWLPHVCLSDPVMAEKVLSTTNHINKGRFSYDQLRPWLGEGLLTSARSKWSRRRKLLTPSFHFKILEDFVPIFNEQASILVDCLKGNADVKGKSKTFDIYPYIAKCTLDVICETAMGIKINAQTSAANKIFIDAINGITALVMEKALTPWKTFPILSSITGISTRERNYLQILHKFSDEIIQTRKVEASKKGTRITNSNVDSSSNSYYGKQRKAFLDLLLEYSDNGRVLSDSDIREEVDTFMFEGQDTTGVNLAWVILLLAGHQKYQTLVQEELDSIFEDNPGRDVTTGDVARMKYLECCIKETLRLYPSVPFILRETDEDIVIGDGRIVPKGITVIVPIYFIHRDPRYHEDPLTFKPERFMEDEGKSRYPFAYVPFSAGPRNCIGQKFALLEEKIILAKLFHQYRFEADAEHVKNVVAVPDMILRSKDGIHVKLFRRK